jgi:hypothetical protein
MYELYSLTLIPSIYPGRSSVEPHGTGPTPNLTDAVRLDGIQAVNMLEIYIFVLIMAQG